VACSGQTVKFLSRSHIFSLTFLHMIGPEHSGV
jgi:hypothetical protein